MSPNAKKLGTDPYKGVRDFYPEDMSVEKRIFSIWRDVSEKHGYEEYAASVLEPAELYRSKTSDEIVSEQTYTFTDRGDREVTLRPEMTPTVARMVAGKKRELTFPLRWYSIPNLFRYEQPQRGRVREHWQLNVDIFGVSSLAAEIEVISMAHDITRAYGLGEADFVIRLNNRKLVNHMTTELFGLDPESAKKLVRLLDKKDKISAESFKATVYDILRGVSAEDASAEVNAKVEQLLTLIGTKDLGEFGDKPGVSELKEVIDGLHKLGIDNVRFDPTLMRGFDYYTGIVFEVYDMNPANKRSIFGGGRYDDLLSMFGNDKVTAVGFGAGDVIARDLMETYGSLPTTTPPADISICVTGENTEHALSAARSMRAKGIRVCVDLSDKKLGDQISNADKRGIPSVIVIGDEEAKSGKYKLKTLKTGEEKIVSLDDLTSSIR